MKFSVITLFPNVINEYINSSIIKKARDNGKVIIDVYDLRDYGKTKRKNTDDTIYGGGTGMLISVDVLDKALQSIQSVQDEKTLIIYVTPKGKKISQEDLKNTKSLYDHIVIICGHYEGIDERIFKLYNILEYSIGDYVLTGGELPALVLIDGISRLVKGVLKDDATKDESFEDYLLEEPKYTKPSNYKDILVPDIYLSGNHEMINKYRYEEKIYETYKKRPDLLKKYIKENNLKNEVKEIIKNKRRRK